MSSNLIPPVAEVDGLLLAPHERWVATRLSVRLQRRGLRSQTQAREIAKHGSRGLILIEVFRWFGLMFAVTGLLGALWLKSSSASNDGGYWLLGISIGGEVYVMCRCLQSFRLRPDDADLAFIRERDGELKSLPSR